MRTAWPEVRTLPSSRFATPSFSAIVRTSSFLPLNWNDEVRAITFKSAECARWSISSSDRPSEKYSWSFFSLMSTNGSTAIDFSGIVTAAAAVGGTFAGELAGGADFIVDDHGRSHARTT